MGRGAGRGPGRHAWLRGALPYRECAIAPATSANPIKATYEAAATTKLAVGQKSTYTRTFTRKDVATFAELSGDKGIHHMVPDGKGRVMIQGLLTATLPTKLGGDLNYIARKMDFEFLRPVFVGDTVTCEGTVASMAESDDRLEVSMSLLCRNQDGKEVLRGRTEGIIRR